jgi:uncharacterized repeat protein (TIGR02543 family)
MFAQVPLSVGNTVKDVTWTHSNTLVVAMSETEMVTAIVPVQATITTRNGVDQYTVIYDGNGSTDGGVPVDEMIYGDDDVLTVFGPGDLARTGHVFAGWSTRPDGSGTYCSPGKTFSIMDVGILDYVVGSTLTLYAQWSGNGGDVILPTGVSISPMAVSLSVNATRQLVATVLPANGVDRSLTWMSSNTSVVTVSETGVVTTKATGTATITAQTVNDLTANCKVTVTTATASFKVEGTKIIGLDGSEFLVKGVNVRGPDWGFARSTLQDLDLIVDVWQFNTIRLYMTMGMAWTWSQSYSEELDEIIDGFTSRGIVVMLELHDWTGLWPGDTGYWTNERQYWNDYVPALSEMIDWWVDKAERFSDNPYVWFNIMNEPGIDNTEESATKWLNIHDAVIKAIRDTGAENIIVLDEHNWGQGNSYYGGASSYDSAVIRMGPTLNEQYTNLVFSLHVYDAWADGKDRFDTYFQDAKDRGLCVILGEFGVGITRGQHEAVKNMYESAISHGIGRIYWAWDNSLPLTTTGEGSGWTIDKTDGTKPTNLAWVGECVWADNRGLLTTPVPDFDPNLPLITNGGFELGLSGWMNWGGNAISIVNGASYDGSNALSIAFGSTGGIGQILALEPNTTYRFSVWAKGSGDLGIKYRLDTVDDFEYHNMLLFTEDDWENKFITFTTPDKFYFVMHFMWKGFPYSDFYVDNIELIKVNVDNVEIETLPVKLTYQIGEALDLAGLALQVNYADYPSERLEVKNTMTALNVKEERTLEGSVIVDGFDSQTSGTKTVTVTYNGCTTTFDVRVMEGNGIFVPETNILLDKTMVTLTAGEMMALTAVVMPNDATDKTVAWSNDNPAVASVTANGLVTAKTAGTAAITATTVNGLTASCNLTVNAGGKYTITYDGNNSTDGTVPVDKKSYGDADIVTVFGPGDLARAGYNFVGWNTRSDGGGTYCGTGRTFGILDAGIIDYVLELNLALYAQWSPK